MTSAGLLGSPKVGDELSLVLRPHQLSQQMSMANVVRVDAATGVVVLKLPQGGDVPALELGDDRALRETQDLTAYGFPLGGRAKYQSTRFPKSSRKVGAVSSLRTRQNSLEVIQFDAPDVQPGDSGGPVLDSGGRVVGIVRATFDAADIHLVTPVSKLRTALQPNIDCVPPRITRANVGQPVTFSAQVSSILGPNGPYSLELQIKAGDGPLQSHAMTYSGGRFRARVVPVRTEDIVSGPFDLHWIIVVSKDGTEVARKSSEIAIAGKGATISPPRLATDPLTIPIDFAIDDVLVAGRGRWLILHGRQSQQLVVVDLSIARITRRIDLGDADAIVTAGLDKLLAVLPSSKEVRRWNLTTLAEDVSETLTNAGEIDLICLGSGSEGPALMSATNDAGEREWSLLDLQTLESAPLELTSGSLPADATLASASSNGSVFYLWRRGKSGVTTMLHLNDERAEARPLPMGLRAYAAPSPDGKLLFSETFAAATDGSELGNVPRAQSFVPAHHGNYFLAMLKSPLDVGYENRVALFRAGDARPLAKLHQFREFFELGRVFEPLALPQRVHLVPAARLLVTVPREGNRVVLHGFDTEHPDQHLSVARRSAAAAGSADLLKDAAALVVLPSGAGFGSGFCVDDRGYFVTNEHVVEGLRPGQSVTLVLNSGESTEREYRAELVKTDVRTDLALLRIDAKEKFAALPLGDDDSLAEQMQVRAVGFPFGDALAVRGQKFPNVSINVGPVRSLNAKSFSKDAIEIGIQMNPGNSGGPVLDPEGNVVGVVYSTVLGRRRSYAVSLAKLRTFIEQPQIDLTLPQLHRSNVHRPQDFLVRLDYPIPPKESVQVELWLDRQVAEQVYRLKQTEEHYRATVTPLPTGTPKVVETVLNFRDGSLKGTLADREFRVGEQQVSLSDVASVDLGKEPVVTTNDGRRLLGKLQGLDDVAARVGKTRVEVDFGMAESAKFVSRSRTAFPFRLTVRAGSVVSTRLGELKVESGKTPERIPIPSRRIPLPDVVSRVVAGGGGRWLICHVPQRRQLLVFDSTAGDFTHHLDLSHDDVLLAANASKLLVVYPFQREIQRWDLNGGRLELTKKFLSKRPPAQLICGSASRGPALVYWPPADSARERYAWVDVASLGLRDVSSPALPDLEPGRDRLRVSSDGRTFAIAHGSSRTTLFSSNSKEATELRFGAFAPGPNGRYLFGAPGIRTLVDRRLEDVPQGRRLRPAHHGPFYWAFSPPSRASRSVGSVAVHVIGDARPLLTIPFESRRSSPLDQSVHVVPRSKMVVTVDASSRSLQLHTFDCEALSRDAEPPWLFLTSATPAFATRGETLQHQFQVASTHEVARYNLTSGPKGMRLSNEGLLTWSVPVSFHKDVAAVAMRIEDVRGNHRYHTFRLQVTD